MKWFKHFIIIVLTFTLAFFSALGAADRFLHVGTITNAFLANWLPNPQSEAFAALLLLAELIVVLAYFDVKLYRFKHD